MIATLMLRRSPAFHLRLEPDHDDLYLHSESALPYHVTTRQNQFPDSISKTISYTGNTKKKKIKKIQENKNNQIDHNMPFIANVPIDFSGMKYFHKHFSKQC